MFTAISSIILALAVVIGGGGITAYAAQESLPNDALYPVKLFLEDTTYSLTSDLETQVGLLTTFANNRIDEIVTLSLAGEPVSQDVVADLQTDLDTMLLLAADAADDETEDLLKYIRQNLRDRDQLMTMSGQPDDVDPALGQLRAMLQAQHQRAQAGVEDPLQFKHMFRNNWKETAEDATGPKGTKGNQTASAPKKTANLKVQRGQMLRQAVGTKQRLVQSTSGTIQATKMAILILAMLHPETPTPAMLNPERVTVMQSLVMLIPVMLTLETLLLVTPTLAMAKLAIRILVTRSWRSRSRKP